MSSRFEWKDAYLLGNEEIDRQHKYLLSTALSFELSSSKEDAIISLMEVYRYTREHFALEEAYMRSVNYPAYDAHRQLHNSLITKFNSLVQGFDNSVENKNKIVDFFASWIINHIAAEDKKIAEFAQQ